MFYVNLNAKRFYYSFHAGDHVGLIPYFLGGGYQQFTVNLYVYSFITKYRISQELYEKGILKSNEKELIFAFQSL